MANKKSERNENLIALYEGLGDASPSGSNRWSVQELADKYKMSRVRVHQILKQYNVKTVNKRSQDRELEINKLAYVMDNILTEVGARNLKDERTKDLAIAYDKFANRMKQVTKAEEDALNVVGILEEITASLETGKVIDIEAE